MLPACGRNVPSLRPYVREAATMCTAAARRPGRAALEPTIHTHAPRQQSAVRSPQPAPHGGPRPQGVAAPSCGCAGLQRGCSPASRAVARLHGCTVAGLRETVATHRTLEGLELQNERNRIMRLELLLAMGTTSLALSATVVHHTPRACSRARNRARNRACNRARNRARNCACKCNRARNRACSRTCSRACSRAVTARGVGLHATA